MVRFLSTFLGGCILLASVTVGHAESKPQTLGVFKQWVAYELSKEKTCWNATTPVSDLKREQRGDVVVMTTHRPKSGVRNEISYYAGAALDEKKAVEVVIDGRTKFSMVSKGKWAWLRNVVDEGRMVAAMKSGHDMVITAVMADGKRHKDKYSLSGYTAAYKAITKACY